MGKKKLDAAELHTPDELLEAAHLFLGKNDSHHNRAVVLEAFTALEGYVENVIFKLLEDKLDPLLVQWMRSKTQMDFPTRLSTFVPVAISQPPLEKGEGLWQQYQIAKNTRNLVAHTGYKVSHEEAKQVISAVSEWLEYLGSSGEIELSLLELKKYIENNQKSFEKKKPEEYEKYIYEYFKNSSPANVKEELSLDNQNRVDLILSFDKTNVGLEIKYVKKKTGANHLISKAYDHAKLILSDPSIDRVVLVTLCDFKLPKELETPRISDEISLLAISLKS